MLDASADTDEVHARALGRFAIDPAIADVHGARCVDARALQAQPKNIGRRLGANLVERAGDRVEYARQTKMLDQSGHGRRSISREPELVAPLEVQHERTPLERRAEPQ